ncbi:MAG: Bax inhibitor-1/YccA family protein [Elusimicrobiota bacterium]
MNTDYMTEDMVAAEQRRFMNKVYGWMSIGLVLTGFIAHFVMSSPVLFRSIAGNPIIFFGLIIGELIIVFKLAGSIMNISAGRATALFLGYSAMNGLTLSVVFAVYTAESIAVTFFVTAGTFAVMSLYGYVTKRDLTGVGQFMIMGLIGIIIASVVNFFLKSSQLYWMITYIGILIFVGLTAYDTQKIKQMNIIGNDGTDEDRKEAVLGALRLYLDFINLFLMLLRLFGNRRGGWR